MHIVCYQYEVQSLDNWSYVLEEIYVSLMKNLYTISNNINQEVIIKTNMNENHMYMLKMQLTIAKCLKYTIDLSWLW